MGWKKRKGEASANEISLGEKVSLRGPTRGKSEPTESFRCQADENGLMKILGRRLPVKGRKELRLESSNRKDAAFSKTCVKKGGRHSRKKIFPSRSRW